MLSKISFSPSIIGSITISMEKIIIQPINSNLKQNEVYYLGSYLRSEKTVNVAQKLPNLYSKLTADNFIVMPGKIGWSQGKIEQHSGSGDWYVEYDNSTGILTFHTSYNASGHGTAHTSENKVYVIIGNIETI